MTGESWRARALVDLDALRGNARVIRQVATDSRLLAVIKADAYGHGLETVVAALADSVHGFAVATLEEGIRCRGCQPGLPVVVLSEFWSPGQLAEFTRHALDPVVHSLAQVGWLEHHRGAPLDVWIKFDTGMNRLGLDPGAAPEVIGRLQQVATVRTIRLMSHFANADLADDDYSPLQMQRFAGLVAPWDFECSLANSAGTLRYPAARYHWVRPGLALYGVSPQGAGAQNLSPVMTLQARLIAVRDIGAGQPVGYGGRHVTRRPTRIGLVGTGYGDGYPRSIDQRAFVNILDRPAPVIGNISMDMITVDVTDIPGVEPGTPVTLWGDFPGVEEVAEWAGTIPYELLCKVTPRIPREAITANPARVDRVALNG